MTAMSMDAPTETQFDVPVQARASHDPVKGLDTAKKWSSKITGLMVAGLGLMAFVTRDGLGSGPNLSCTVLYLGLMALVAAGRPIGTSLNILLDNTGADNKNNEMMFFLAWLVATDVIGEGSFFCMMVGHTYSAIDQSFRTLIRQLYSFPIWTVLQLLSRIHEYLRPYNCLEVHELHCLWDWKAFFKDHVHTRFGGFGTGQYGTGMHEFVLRKDCNGDVRLWLRTSAQSSGWLPEGDGYLVFKSLPKGPPPLAPLDKTWKRDVVQATVRAWFPYMRVSPQEEARIKQEWSERFACLPPDGDPEQLPADKKLRWMELPKAFNIRGPENDVAARGFLAGSRIENPEVNPVVGPGRTAAQIQAEVATYKARMRAMSNVALFQADFLFVKYNTEVLLCRVAHGACLFLALEEDIAITCLAYEHHAQPGHAGFWGTFTKKKNPAYNPADSKCGTQFVRLPNVSRDEILVYDVHVFETASSTPGEPKELRVTTESLRALSQKSEQHQPKVLSVPETHSSDAPAGAGDADDGGALLHPLVRNKVPALRAELERRNLRSDGLKLVLVARLTEAMEGEGGDVDGVDGGGANGMPPLRPPLLHTTLLRLSYTSTHPHTQACCAFCRWRG